VSERKTWTVAKPGPLIANWAALFRVPACQEWIFFLVELLDNDDLIRMLIIF
jgi:hypothetical protein